MHQPLRDKLLKTAFGSTEKPGKLFQTLLYFCGFLWEYCCLILDLILTKYKLLYHALVTCGVTCGVRAVARGV